HLDQELAFNLIQEIMQLLRKTIHEFMVKLKRDIKFSLNLNDLGKQNRLHKYLVDFIVEDRNLRSEILQQVNQVFLSSDRYKKHRPIFYIDVDPYDLS
ncbi:hypothetical protein, partial [Psittacicella gerlachiana]